MTMTEKIFSRASEKTQLSPGDNVWVNVDILMTHDISGPPAFGIFQREFGENAKVSTILISSLFMNMGFCFVFVLNEASDIYTFR